VVDTRNATAKTRASKARVVALSDVTISALSVA
jgi:hypothetical protein